MSTSAPAVQAARAGAARQADPLPPRTRNFGIDCLRGLAILLVIVHHLALPFRLPLEPSLLGTWWPNRLVDAISFNGYEAVFIFFVISGFLIATRIIERDGELARVKLRRFYAARAKRILPLLGLILALLSPRQARMLALTGGLCLVLVLGWSELVYRHLFKSGLYGLCVGACLLLLAGHAHPMAPRRGLGWLARMGELSYELYLSHMFVVLAVVAAYRGLPGENQAWSFVVYLPVLVLCRALAGALARMMARLQAQWPAVTQTTDRKARR